jgi:hypothetical protein
VRPVPRSHKYDRLLIVVHSESTCGEQARRSRTRLELPDRAPAKGVDLASQPALSRFENKVDPGNSIVWAPLARSYTLVAPVIQTTSPSPKHPPRNLALKATSHPCLHEECRLRTCDGDQDGSWSKGGEGGEAAQRCSAG